MFLNSIGYIYTDPCKAPIIYWMLSKRSNPVHPCYSSNYCAILWRQVKHSVVYTVLKQTLFTCSLKGGSPEPHFHFNDIHIQIIATTKLASFPGSAHVACLTLVHLAQNEEELGLFSLKDQVQPVKMLSFLKQLVQIELNTFYVIVR